MRRARLAGGLGVALLLAASGLAVATCLAVRQPPHALPGTPSPDERQRFLDRRGTPLSFTYQNPWNTHDVVPLHEIPVLLREAFVQAEDRRFYGHGGVDWIARLHALVQNLRAGRVVRGASTLTEQSVRMLHPRPRTPWSRWVEGFEASGLEARFTKSQILEFYLNQVPYARRRRGVVQAARDYFDRTLDTLSPAEMLALAVLVRSPDRLDLHRGTHAIRAPVSQLARRLHRRGVLGSAELDAILRAPPSVLRPEPPVEAAHFVGFVRSRIPAQARPARVLTTLDAGLQARVQRLLDRQVASLADQDVGDAAALVVEHGSGEVLAWVNAGSFTDRDGGQIDAIRTPRQPGSTLKPFLYGLALEQGWTPATLIDDAPLAQPVGHGLHRYRNYSRVHHGPLRLRDALGNSLNLPAIRTIRSVGHSVFLERLRLLGMASLREHPDHYGDGLALGNGEVTLLELVRAYAALARAGTFRELRTVLAEFPPEAPRRVYDPMVSSLVADILSDPGARTLEFGASGLLEFPTQTALKTGTSNDHRDAWAIGFSHRFTVGVWMGNLDRRPMRDITGSRGPALVLRAIFAELNRHGSRPLAVARPLERHAICRVSGRAPTAVCPLVEEWFRPGRAPQDPCPLHGAAPVGRVVTAGGSNAVRLESPSPGLHLAMDPRIPDDLEVFPLRLSGASDAAQVEWIVDERVVAVTSEAREFPWPVSRGAHIARARVLAPGGVVETAPVPFLVK